MGFGNWGMRGGLRMILWWGLEYDLIYCCPYWFTWAPFPYQDSKTIEMVLGQEMIKWVAQERRFAVWMGEDDRLHLRVWVDSYVTSTYLMSPFPHYLSVSSAPGFNYANCIPSCGLLYLILARYHYFALTVVHWPTLSQCASHLKSFLHPPSLPNCEEMWLWSQLSARETPNSVSHLVSSEVKQGRNSTCY
jgi:hypothetical protein